jgi:hypothetical protein
LLTYSGRDGRRKAGNAEAARVVFNGDGGILWCALRLWNQLLKQRSGSDNLLRGLARRGKLQVGKKLVARFGNASGNGEKCSWGARVLLFVGQRV